MTCILGIDPGKEGGFAILDGDSVIVEPMPQLNDEIDVAELVRLLAHYAPQVTACYLENVPIIPKNGSVAHFKLGRSMGMLEGILHALDVPIHLVKPMTWTKAYDHGSLPDGKVDRNARERAIKVARREIVARLFPGINLLKTERSSVPHEGMVDALLIAKYGFDLAHKF